MVTGAPPGLAWTKATVEGVPPIFTAGSKPDARVTPYLTDEKSLRDKLGAAWPIIALRIHAAKFKLHQSSSSQKNGGHSRE